jgi:hypothetical protein
MIFEYEITADEYVASQLLCHRLSGGRKRVERAVSWLLAGFVLIVVALNEWSHNWARFLVALTGALCIYSGVVSFFPARFFRRAYPSSEVVGKKFKANVTEDGFEVTGELCSWLVRWPAVRFKGENEQVFMLYSHGTIFMFGKKYLDSEQQQHLRKLSGLT